MLKNLILLILSVLLFFSCSKKNKEVVDVNSDEAVVLDGKVKEKGCKRFDFYCKRTGKKLDTRNLESSPEATEEELAISIYYEAVDALNAGDAFTARGRQTVTGGTESLGVERS